MEPEGSLPQSQQPATCHYHKPDGSSPILHFYFIKPVAYYPTSSLDLPISLSQTYIQGGGGINELYQSNITHALTWDIILQNTYYKMETDIRQFYILQIQMHHSVFPSRETTCCPLRHQHPNCFVFLVMRALHGPETGSIVCHKTWCTSSLRATYQADNRPLSQETPHCLRHRNVNTTTTSMRTRPVVCVLSSE
jgi:hypothetical protein